MSKSANLLIYILRKLFETAFLIIRLFIERFLKPIWVIVLLLFYILFVSLPIFSKTLNGFRIPEYTLIKEYLATLLSLPTAVLVIGFIFLLKFSPSIKTFLENSRPSQVGPVGVEQLETQTSTTEENPVNPNEAIITDRAQEITVLSERAERFEFFYLSISLVYNTKAALMWVYLQPVHSSTKENFLTFYILPPLIVNPEIEKEAIFGALLVNQLLQPSENQFEVTEKGKRFLIYLGFNIES